MSLLFKNYSLVEVIHLFIRFNKTKFFPWNTKNTDRNGVNKQIFTDTKHSEKDYTGKGLVSIKIKVIKQPPPIFTNSSFYGKISEKTGNPILSNKCNKKACLWEKQQQSK